MCLFRQFFLSFSIGSLDDCDISVTVRCGSLNVCAQVNNLAVSLCVDISFLCNNGDSVLISYVLLFAGDKIDWCGLLRGAIRLHLVLLLRLLV